MLTCVFEDGDKTSLRHVVLHAVLEYKGKLLLEKRAGNILETGKWALPGGYLDRNETVSQGILRELKEETGWEGEVITLFRINSNPNRPKEDRQNVAFEFLVKPLHQVERRDTEASKIEWILLDKLLPYKEFAFDHGETIRLYLNYRKKRFPLPLIV